MAKKIHHVMPDIKPYKSMVTGEIISGRRQHREHLKRHGCVEVGNDLPKAPQGIPDTNPQQRHELIREQVNNFTDAQFRRMIMRDVRNRRDNPRQYLIDSED